MSIVSARTLLRSAAALAIAVAFGSGDASAQVLRLGSGGQVVVSPGTVTVGSQNGGGIRIGGGSGWLPHPIHRPTPIMPSPIQPGPINPGVIMPAPGVGAPSVGNPGYGNPGYGGLPPYYGRPSQPVLVTPDQFQGINPQTGGIDTRNDQINDTYFDHGRHESEHNGTKRWVRRPVYRNGQVVGYQEGYVWNNSRTGQEHGTLKTVTPNDKGGIHTGIVQQSVQ